MNQTKTVTIRIGSAARSAQALDSADLFLICEARLLKRTRTLETYSMPEEGARKLLRMVLNSPALSGHHGDDPRETKRDIAASRRLVQQIEKTLETLSA